MSASKPLFSYSLKVAIFLLLSLLCFTSMAQASSWSELKKPIPGKPEPIGGYSNGCIIGAETLPLQGKGFQVTRSYKNRYYGDPSLITFIKNLGRKLKQKGYPSMLIGDLGMPAGGRFETGHVSHQSGLDVDIFLHFGPATKAELKKPEPVYMVDYKAETVNKNWTNKQATLIRLAAQDPNVNRIFVNPAIKVQLCKTAIGNRSWLHKVRPWFAHRAHMHVRLNCPKGAKYCQSQAPIPKGLGCDDTLYSWFKPAPKSSKPKVHKPRPVPPALCQMAISQYE